MEQFKRIIKKWFFLPLVPTVLISIPSYALVIYALAGENVDPVIAYTSYILSAYALVVTITGIFGIVHWIRQGIEQHPFGKRILGVPLFKRYLREKTFRAEASLYTGFFINMLYVGIKLFSGIFYRSIWFGSLAVYYILLAVMRFSLLHHVRNKEGIGKDRGSEWHRYRLCGILLLFMNAALVGIIVFVVHLNSGFAYPGLLIYVMAMYAFYATITAVVNVIKFRKYGSPVLSAAKMVNLTAALVSMLSLETAMLTQFGAAEDKSFRQSMTASTGAGVSIIVVGMAAYMIVHATKMLKKEKMEERCMINILVLEDDVKLNQIVCTYLNDSGFQAQGCLNAKEAYAEMYNNLYELIISDIMMPEIDGFEFARTVRQVNKNVPILFMSAKDDLPSKQKGFQLGIDDYMVKPIELAELLLRVRALLRRANIEMERKITVGNLVLDADGMSAEINGEEIALTTREFNIIYKMLSYPKKTFSRAQLMDEFWGVDSDTSLRAVDVYVTKLRDKLSACDGFKIVTVRGLGYKVVLA